MNVPQKNSIKETIGIIGGAGVAATNTLCALIEIARLKAGAFRDAHHPEMIIYQATQAPSRSMFLEGKSVSFIEDYIDVANKLRLAGASKIGMCCNTAHWGIDMIQQGCGVPFINMVEEVVLEARRSGKKNIALIASDGCLKGKVYEKYFSSAFPEANIIYPPNNVQKNITNGICGIKNKSRLLPLEHPERPCAIFKRVSEEMLARGAELLLIGCTDIRVDFKTENSIDSLETLAKSILRESFHEQ